jgi:uncharacterized membrane protein YgcG
MMRRLLSAIALLFVAPGLAAAQDRTLAIETFDTRIVVGVDRSLDITEKIRFRFDGSWNGVYRMVPLEYRTSTGFQWTVRADLIEATDDQGTPLEVEQLRERHYRKFKIWVPGAQNTTKTITLRYRVEGGLRFFEDHDELYWNATGDEWDVPLGMVTAEVVLPDGASGVRATSFNGVYGSAATEATSAIDGGRISFAMPRKLEYREGLTVVVGWDKGLVPTPTALEEVSWFLRDNWPLGIPILVFAFMFALWSRRGRDPALRPVAVRYEPPTGVTPAEAGTLHDESVDMRDITATMIDLAVRGYLKIEEIEGTKVFGMEFGESYRFRRTKDPREWEALAPHERKVLKGVFGSAATVDLDDLTNEFYTSISGIKDGVFSELVKKKYYGRRPDRVRAAWIGGGLAVCMLFGIVGSALGVAAGFTPIPFVAAAAASFIIIVIFGWNMPARTLSGTRALEEVLGYREFLDRVDSERFRNVVKTPEMFEQGLPYAMALGVEKRWAKAFDGIFTTPPQWYAGHRMAHFNASSFSRSLGTMSTTASSVMTSQPRSSSGSGFSSGGGGGGFSGGGGGGGGGGGF